MLPIAVDAMGGDHAPAEILAGAHQAAELGIPILLVGPEGLSGAGELPVFAASEVIEMDDDPAQSVRRKRDSTLVRAAEAVRDGHASAMISAGNTGATMASAEFSADSEEKRPTVQIGDPFAEKLLIEACMELMATDAIVAIQDMGWTLSDVQKREFQAGRLQNNSNPLIVSQVQQIEWLTEITAEMIAVALLKPERMRTVDLFGYIQHLNNNEQSAQRYEIEFWRKVFYPLSCLVMVVLALPFAYLHTRSGGVAGYVFIGVMIGISFFLLNNMFGFIGNLRQWTPWFAAGLPSMIYSVLSLSAFGWLVLRR
jgi:hypothetical protein